MPLLLCATPVAPGGTPIRFADALARVDAAADVAGASEAARIRRDGLGRLNSVFTSNPQLTLQPGYRTETNGAGLEGQLTLQQSFNLGGLARARRAVAEEEASVAGSMHRLTRLERRISVAELWLETWAAQAASDAAHEEEDAAKELITRLEHAQSTGGVTKVELATARAFAAEAAALHLEWEGRRVEAGAALADLLGLDHIALADGPLPEFVTSGVTLDPRRHARVLVAEAEVRAERERAVETKAQWATQLQVSLQGGHDAPDQWFGNVGLGVTLPLLEHGAREATAHEAAVRRLEGELTQEQRRANIRLELVRHELEHTAETLEVVKGQQLPAATEAAALEAKRFAQGEATLLELTVLRRQALAARIAAVVAEARYIAARAHARELEESR
ncbi:MAG: TolC family protein [Myxococcota bacterium]